MEYVGLFGGIVFALLGLYFGRRAAKKNRGLDELHDHIWQKARSISWYITLVAIYVLLILSILKVEISLIPALGILLLVHMGSWGVTGGFLMAKMAEGDTQESGKMQMLLSMLIGTVFLIGFGIVSAVTGNWKFFLFSLFPIFLTVTITYSQVMRRKKQHENPQ